MPSGRPSSSTKSAPNADAHELVALSQSLLQAVRDDAQVEVHLGQLAKIDPLRFIKALNDDGGRKAFWINLYNALHLYASGIGPPTDKASKWKFYFSRSWVVGAHSVSLNDIEHSILRKSRLWWARGYLPKPFEAMILKGYRVDKRDPRIHFALNCGAASCPAIQFYSLEHIDDELEMATQAFMATEVAMTSDGFLEVSGIFKMYAGDFGGNRGIKKWIATYRHDLPIDRLRLRFLPFDGTPSPKKFAADVLG